MIAINYFHCFLLRFSCVLFCVFFAFKKNYNINDFTRRMRRRRRRRVLPIIFLSIKICVILTAFLIETLNQCHFLNEFSRRPFVWIRDYWSDCCLRRAGLAMRQEIVNFSRFPGQISPVIN